MAKQFFSLRYGKGDGLGLGNPADREPETELSIPVVFGNATTGRDQLFNLRAVNDASLSKKASKFVGCEVV
jgi:hypothetical protein